MSTKTKSQHQEWQKEKTWNPFNSLKLLAHVDRWKAIKDEGLLPPPVSVTIDPTNYCNFKCIWCNARPVIKNRARKLSTKAIHSIANALHQWSDYSPFRVNAVCIAGGGEPLLNYESSLLINVLVQKGLDVGIVTNGSYMDKFIHDLSMCHWVSVSIDAGTSHTFSKLKGVNPDQFDHVIENIKKLNRYSKKHSSPLSNPALSFGVTYKFLATPDNIHEIVKATKLAKSIGCKCIQIRPVGTPWFKIKKNCIEFKKELISLFHSQILEAHKYNDHSFGVYGVTHKFDKNFLPSNNFNKCHAVLMTAVFMPPYKDDDQDSFVLGLCCDRRGDARLELARNIDTPEAVMGLWGSSRHYKIQKSILLEDCPRCTYSPHNQIFENVILNDNMSLEFI